MNTFKRLFALLPFVFLGMTAMAQNADNGLKETGNAASNFFAERLYAHIGFGASTKHDGMTPAEFTAEIGYKFIPRMYAYFHASGLYGLYDKDHGQTYTKTTNILGGGLGYTLYKPDNGAISIDLRGTVAASVGKADWKQTSYDAMLLFRIGRGTLKADIGIGYKHITSHTAGIGAYNGLAVSLGFGF